MQVQKFKMAEKKEAMGRTEVGGGVEASGLVLGVDRLATVPVREVFREDTLVLCGGILRKHKTRKMGRFWGLTVLQRRM